MLNAYSGKNSKQNFASLFEDEDVEVVGNMTSAVEHAAKDIEPERLKFVGEPSFDPSPYLDYANRAHYLRPLDHCRGVEAEDGDLLRVRVRCKKGAQLGLLEKLDKVKRLVLKPCAEVRMNLLNGMFCLPKDKNRDRMILDARRPNAVEEAEGRWIYSLGSAAQLNHVHLAEDEILLIHPEDLREYYHCFVIQDQEEEKKWVT